VLTFRKYLVLAGIVLFGSLGDVALKRGMMDIGALAADRWRDLLWAPLNPWVALGVLLLLAFFTSYLSALSWADLTYVLPATALGYVMVAVAGKFLLGEDVSVTRWAGILLITAGVGWVTRGPALTSKKHPHIPGEEVAEAIFAAGGEDS
jgi:drug/metabolite transporter (DMT)-like permease